VLRPAGVVTAEIGNPARGNPIVLDNVPAIGTRQRSSQNLRPWPKGVSGNPAGRPREEVDRWIKVIVRLVLERAVSGDIGACAEIFNRTEGRKRQSITVD
jgi:hypothetical protein